TGVDGDNRVGNRLRTGGVHRHRHGAGDDAERIDGDRRHPLRHVDGAALKAARDRARGQPRDDGTEDRRRAVARPRGSVVAHRLDTWSQSMMLPEAATWIW